MNDGVNYKLRRNTLSNSHQFHLKMNVIKYLSEISTAP